MNANYIMNGTAIVRKGVALNATQYVAKGGRVVSLVGGESFGAACVVDAAKFTPKASPVKVAVAPKAAKSGRSAAQLANDARLGELAKARKAAKAGVSVAPVAAKAATDLSGMTTDQLVTMNARIIAELASRI